MLFFTTGLSFYYIPKLSSIHTNAEFKGELKNYFKTIIPLFIVVVLLFIFFKDIVIQIALTEEFQEVKTVLFWQLSGDFLRLLTLAFGYQILVKTMMKKYIAVELLFNISYFVLSYFMIQKSAVTGALQAYCIANFITFCLVFWMFRNTLFSKTN
jgi:PST family polysaccharide transporter